MTVRLMEEYIFISHIMQDRAEYIIVMILQIRESQKKGKAANYLYLLRHSNSTASVQSVQTMKELFTIKMTAAI